MISMADERLRVAHLPARTPYARKLYGPAFRILNGTEIRAGMTVPAAVTSRWLLDQRPLTWLDVLHLHHIEFENLTDLANLLDACAAATVRVVHTVHDVQPMFSTMEDFASRLQLLASADVSWVCLTHGSLARLTDIIGRPVQATVIPHGYVAAPDSLTDRARDRCGAHSRYLILGAPRPNRDLVATIVNWSLGIADPKAALQLLLRAFSPADFTNHTSQVPHLLEAIRGDPRIKVNMEPYPTDRQVVDAGLEADILILPYLWSTHSGQLELAFDLGLLPVSSTAGYLREQYQAHEGLIEEPEWFDWADSHPYLLGEKLLAALRHAGDRLRQGERQPSRSFLDHRRAEHQQILTAYASVYGAA